MSRLFSLSGVLLDALMPSNLAESLWREGVRSDWLGELATAVGLSTFSLVVGPIFYFIHETLWNYLVPAGSGVDLSAVRGASDDARADRKAIVINRPLAKMITFRTFATVTDFAATYVMIGDAATAGLLTAFGFVLGPFVYLGHEMLWDHYVGPDLPAPRATALPRGGNADHEPSQHNAGVDSLAGASAPRALGASSSILAELQPHHVGALDICAPAGHRAP